MKQKFKKLLGILSLVVLLITFSCTEDLYKDETHSNYNLSFKKISYGEVSTNKKLVSKLSKLKNEKQTKDANGKIIYSSEYEFYVDTDNGNYIEDENGKHSYVFRVYRKSVQNKLDNIVFASQDDNTYKVLLISYDLTPQEQQNLENGNTINVSDNPRTIYLIEDENLTNDIFNRVTVIVTGGCITIIEESCSSGKHDDYTGYGGCQPAYHTVNTYTNCESDGGGGSYSGYTGTGSYNNPTGNTSTTTGSSGNDGTGTTNSGGTSSTGNNTVYTTPTLGNIKSFEQIEREKCFMNDSGLSWEQKAILNSNTSLKEKVLAYLESLVTEDNSDCPTQSGINFIKNLLNHCINNNYNTLESKDYIISNIIVEQIDDSELDDCGKSILNKIKNLSQNNIAKILQSLNGKKALYNYKIKSTLPATSNAMGGTNWTLNASGYAVPFNYTTKINPYETAYSNDIAIASTILHELVHAYFLSLIDQCHTSNGSNCNNLSSFGDLWIYYVENHYSGNLTDLNSQHNQLAQDYIQILASAIQELATNVPLLFNETPSQEYIDLAWIGLEETQPYQSLPESTKDRIQKRFAAEVLRDIQTTNTGLIITPIGSRNLPCN